MSLPFKRFYRCGTVVVLWTAETCLDRIGREVSMSWKKQMSDSDDFLGRPARPGPQPSSRQHKPST
jgi:hypothetical protein